MIAATIAVTTAKMTEGIAATTEVCAVVADRTIPDHPEPFNLCRADLGPLPGAS